MVSKAEMFPFGDVIMGIHSSKPSDAYVCQYIRPSLVQIIARHQAIIWTNIGLLLIGPLGRNFSYILIESHTESSKKMHLKMSAKWRSLWPQCVKNVGMWIMRQVGGSYWDYIVLSYSIDVISTLSFCVFSGWWNVRGQSRETHRTLGQAYVNFIC